MGLLKGLTNLGADINPKHAGMWPQKIGSFILNFASIELISFQYLNSLESTRDDFNKNLDRLLTQRIQRILILVQLSNIEQLYKDEIQSFWVQVKDLAKWRNRIAHNPLLPSWKPRNDPNKNPPDALGIPDIRSLKSSNESDTISMEII